MQKRFLVVALAVLGLLVLASFWQASAPQVRVRPVKPTELPIDGEPLAGGQPLEALPPVQAPLDTPDVQKPRELPPPPPAPLVENDPAKGRIWLRLIDTRSNQPVANTACAIWGLPFNEGWYEFHVIGHRNTDGNGLMSFSAAVVEDPEDEKFDPKRNEICFYMKSLEWFAFPVPVGWHPQIGVYDLAERIEALAGTDCSEPVDVPVAPACTLQITARDEWGVPLPDARIDFATLYSDSAADEWLSMREDAPYCLDEPEWPGWTEDQRREYTQGSVTTSFKLREEESSVVFYLPGEEPRFGAVQLRNLPCVKVGAVGYHPAYGFTSATLQLVPGSNELNLYLRPEGGATLNVRVEWLGEPFGGYNGPAVELVSTGPCGESDLIYESESRHEFRWELAESETNVWQGTIRNLPAGWWDLGCSFEINADGSATRILLNPFETRSVTLYGGYDIRAHWKPIIRCGGTQLERASLRLLGGYDEEPEERSVDHDPETGETEALELTPGTYTVWIPTLQPFEITLKPNEERSDVYELAIVTVRFSIDAQLAALLSPENEPIVLNLLPDDAWDGAEEHLYAMDAGLRKRDEEYDRLKPGVVRTWNVPAGRYNWELLGSANSLYGPIEFTMAGPTRVDFALNALPGLELLQLEFRGFGDERPDVDFEDDGMIDSAVVAMRGGWWADEITRDFGGYLPEDRDVQQLWASDTLLYACGPRGKRVANVYGAGENAWFSVNFPGRTSIQPSQLMRQVAGTLRLRDATDEEAEVYDPFEYHVVAYHENGDWGDYGAVDFIEMEVGRVTLMVTREDPTARDDARYSFASVQVQLTREEQELRLDKLDYKPFGRVTLTFSGRGSPDSPFDAWWYGENAPRPPVVLALDQVVAGTPRYVHLGSPDQLLPQGRLEFVYRDRLLPPGRYKVIPWPGAEEKWHQTFEIKPAATTQATIQGGK